MDGDSQATSASLNALLDALLANSPDAIVVLDEEANIGWASVGLQHLLGHDTKAVVGRSVFGFLHADDVNAAAQLFEQRLDYDGRDLGHEIRVLRADSSWLKVRVTATLLPASPLGAIALTVDSASAAIQREESLRRRVGVVEFVSELASGFMEARGPQEVHARLERSLAEVGLLTGADRVCIWVEHQEERVLETSSSWNRTQTSASAVDRKLARSSMGSAIRAILSNVVSDDDLSNPHDPALEGLGASIGATALLAAPFRANDQRGAVALIRSEPGPSWSGDDAELARSCAHLFGRALSAARSEELLRLSYRDGPVGMSVHSPDGELLDCNPRYLELFGLDMDTRRRHQLQQTVHPDDRSKFAELFAQLSSGDRSRVREELRAFRADGSALWVSVSAVPLNRLGSAEPLILTSVEDISESHRRRADLQRAAHHDGLTGIRNRASMQATLERCASEEKELPSVLIVDLDRFKAVNDSMGHAVGDQLLRLVASRLQHQIDPPDFVARLGGDEFAVISFQPDRAALSHLARRLLDAIDQPFEIDGRILTQTASIGTVFGADCESVAELMVRADRALYAAKDMGRNCHLVFDDAMATEYLERAELEQDLREALAQSALEVHFQPEFSVPEGRIIAAEALLRWQHPTHGMLGADRFISVAETSGLIDAIGRFALRRACQQFAVATATAGREDLLLRVNISGREFARAELQAVVSDALTTSGLSPRRLCLELTETTLMDDPQTAFETITNLHKAGVQFAIDDFGTGYSSLEYLKRLPMDVLKIDRTFIEDLVTNPESQAIVRSILGLSEAMGLEVVAEGVESRAQLQVLAEMGCRRAQGFYVSGALSITDFCRALDSQKLSRN